jgi:hypothetical protein
MRVDKPAVMPHNRTKRTDKSGISSPEIIRSLEHEYPHGDGRIRRLVKRTKNTALYSLSRGQVLHGYEVFLIVVKPTRRIFGREYPPTEIYPCNADFGKTAKSCATLERAEYWFDEFEARARQKVSSPQDYDWKPKN